MLQSGKSADLAGAFGGAGSQSTFGPRGVASIMGKLTTVLAILFMVLTLMLMIVASRKTNVKSVLDKEEVKQEEKQESIKPPPQQDQEEKKSTDLPIE